MRLNNRLQKLETSRGLEKKVEFIVVEDGDDLAALERERFGPDGAPANVTVLFVNTGVPRCEEGTSP